jgi:hypothetical protein
MGLTQKLGTIPLAILTDASNNVGIGAAPSGSYKLEVTGTANISSTLLLGGALSGTTGTFSGILTTPQVKAATSAGLSINANSGTQVADFGAGGGANMTLFGGLSGTSSSFSSTTTATAFIPSGSTVPSNGMYLSAANTLNFATNTTNRLSISSTGVITTTNNISMTGTNAQLLQTVSNSVAGDNVAVFYNSNANSYGMYIGAGTGTNHALYITNAARNADLFKVQGNGQVGIGTSSPVNASLHIANPISSETIRNQDNSAYNTFYNSAGTVRTGYIQFNASAASTIATDIAQALTFNTSGAERMRITSGGLVLINRTATGGENARMQVNTNSQDGILVQQQSSGGFCFKAVGISNGGTYYYQLFTAGASDTGSITSNNGVNTTYATSSDYRIKEDFKDIKGLEKISVIKVYDFKFKNTEHRMDGVIAHELQEIIPYAVVGEKDGEKMQGVDYSLIVPTLVKAVQELSAQNQALKSRLDKANL